MLYSSTSETLPNVYRMLFPLFFQKRRLFPSNGSYMCKYLISSDFQTGHISGIAFYVQVKHFFLYKYDFC